MKYKFSLLASDVDGTLLSGDRELSQETINELRRIKDDVNIILISSRMPGAMLHLQEELGIVGAPLICYNGGLMATYEDQSFRFEHSVGIPLPVLSQIAHFNRGKGFHVSLYHNDNWFVEALDYWANREINNTKVEPEVQRMEKSVEVFQELVAGPHKIMCMGDADKIDKLAKMLEKDFSSSIACYRSKPTYLEIASLETSKGKALSYLGEQMGISAASMIAFGDNYNDISLFEMAGYKVAVENARDELKAIASEVTLHHKLDGVAHSIRKHFT